MKDQEKPIPAALYMVATPIGNLEDLSFRALRILKAADFIAAEDTRETRKLVHHYGFHCDLVSLNEFASERKLTELAGRIKDGEIGVFVSDAGTPGICDPGADFVRAVRAVDSLVVPVPGPSALVTLISASGLNIKSFAFHGFFPRENADRNEICGKISSAGGFHLFFETPHRFKEALEHLAVKFPSAQIVVGRELTKRFETISVGNVAEIAASLANIEPRGEYIIGLNVEKLEEALDIGGLEKLAVELASLGAGQKIITKVLISHGLAKNQAYDLGLKVLQK